MKRTYQVQSKYTPYSKRARTLTTQVNNLKKQVSANKKELKYYDGYFTGTDGDYANKSFFTNVVDSTGTLANPTFIGRKIHVKKIELRVPSTSAVGSGQDDRHFIMWREKRQGKFVPSNLRWPTALDPEYHTLIRMHDFESNVDKYNYYATITFDGNGRLVEFDDQTTAVASGVVVSGDIKASAQNLETITGPFTTTQFRVWYTDS